MIFILSDNHRMSSSSGLLSVAAKAFGYTIFSAAGWRIPVEKAGEPGAIYGGPMFVSIAARQMKWDPICPDPNWVAELPEEFLHRKVKIMTLADARNIKEKVFVEPVDLDGFEGKVFHLGGASLPRYENLKEDMNVIVSDAIDFTSKYRCFIKDGKVVAASCYYHEDITNKAFSEEYLHSKNQEKVIEFANSVIEKSKPINASAYVLDIARFKRDANDWPYVVYKVRPAWMSELYGCEIAAAFDTIAASIIPLKSGN